MPPKTPTTLKDMRALVTGASRGIGRAIALRLARQGHPIILNYRSQDEAAAKVKAEIEALGVECTLAKFDIGSSEASTQAIEALLNDGRGPIGILVNNAGIIRDTLFAMMKKEDWDAVTRTALDGFYNVTRPLVMPMVHQRIGRIINMASYSGVSGNAGQVNYSAAKAAIIGATKALSLEIARRGVTVNAVAPGLIETDMLQGVPIDRILDRVPMHRIGKPEEVAVLVAFLASDDAGYITGQVIGINGGLG